MSNPAFIPDARIEREADDALASYARQYGIVVKPPVPVEEMMEVLYDITVLPEDLSKIFPDAQNVLAAFYVTEAQRLVLVNSALDPDAHPEMAGRYRFTLGHETGHWVLHQHILKEHLDTEPSLFGEASKPRILCRSAAAEPIEVQANKFAAFLLMPKTLVLDVWREKFGTNQRAFNVRDELEAKKSSSAFKPCCDLAREFASVFNVSGEAMQIRMEKLHLIETEPNNQLELF